MRKRLRINEEVWWK